MGAKPTVRSSISWKTGARNWVSPKCERLGVAGHTIGRQASGSSFDACSRRSGPPGNAPARACELALEFFSNHLLKHLFVETQIGHELLEAAIPMLELLQATEFGDTHAAVFLTPRVERGR